MKILLLNDNPVVRKLVALSAQKTKDELSVITAPEEVEDHEYDLLIIDDGKYSDDVFSSLQEALNYKSSLLMATRGNATPAGFDNIINKPFLPTDLVDMFILIEKHLPSEPSKPVEEEDIAFNFEEDETESEMEKSAVEEPSKEINLDDDLVDLEGFDELSIDEEDDVESLIGTGILDEDEVNEVRGLLEDDELDFDHESVQETDMLGSSSLDDLLSEDDLLKDLEETSPLAEEEMSLPEDFSLDGELETESNPQIIDEDEFDLGDLETELSPKPIDEDEFDLGELEDDLLAADTVKEELTFEDETGIDEMEESLPKTMDELVSSEEFDLDELISGNDLEQEESNVPDMTAAMEEDEPEITDEELLVSDALEESFSDLLLEEEDDSLDELAPMSEGEFEALEEQIRSAVEELDEESLGMEIDDLELPGMVLSEDEDPFAGLDERTIKMAVGEEVEELPEEEIAEETSMEEEAVLPESMEEAEEISMEEEDIPFGEKEIALTLPNETKSTNEGVEAIQALIRTLADEEVAKSLKGLNINININFGNNK